jgi:hypothetical protein
MSNHSDNLHAQQSPSSPADDPTAQPGRDARGRFTRGNKGGPGNPFNRRCAALRQLLLERVSDDDLAAIVDRVVEMAKEGDLAAAKLVLSYTVGKPLPAVAPDRLDIDEFDVYQQETKSQAEFMRPINGMPAGLACDMLRAILPALLQDHLRLGAEMFAEHGTDNEEDSQPAAASDAPAPAATGPIDMDQGSGQPCERDTASGRGSRRRKAKPAKEAACQDTAASQTPAPGVALPSVAQLLSFLRYATPATGAGSAGSGEDEAPDGAGPGEGATEGTPMQTVKRAANLDR